MRALLILLALIFSTQIADAQRSSKKATDKQLKKLERAFSYIDKYYIEDVDMAPLVEDAIKNMLWKLDPHSTYLSAEDMKVQTARLRGEFTGVGIQNILIRDTIIVVDTFKDSPAEKAGILSGDRIIRVNATNLVKLKMSDAHKYLSGKKGSKIEIGVVRRGEPTPLSFTLTRDDIQTNNIDSFYTIGDSVLYIKVNSFGYTMMDEFRVIYHALKPLKGIIIDLRNNKGGLLPQAIEMAEFFLEKDRLIVSTEGRSVPSQSFHSSKGEKFLDGNVVILINEVSASASELVAGAIQDWDRGIIVGQRSFGKGLVQRRISLEDGSSIGITIAKYLTPSGRAIQRPYTKGEKEEYYTKKNDSLNIVDEKLKYKTLVNKRVVYGAGGITPDIIIPIDTTYRTKYYSEMVEKAIIHRYAYALINKHRDSLATAYPTFDEYSRDFDITEKYLKSLAEFADSNGVEHSSEQMKISKSRIKIDLKALIASKLFSESEMYRIINKNGNTEHQKAIEIMEDWDEIAVPILTGKK